MQGITRTAAFAALLVLAHGAQATVMLNSTDRSIEAFVGGASGGTDGATSAAAGVFDEFREVIDSGNPGRYADAAQNTTIGMTAFSGTGSANACCFVDDVFGASLFDVTFTLGAAYSAAIEYDISAGGETGPSTAGFLLSGPGITTIGETITLTDGGSDTRTDTLMAMLGAGTYTLSVYATAGAETSSNVATGAGFEFSVSLTPKAAVPEPAPLALAGVGLLGLAAGRRSRQR